MKYILAIAGFGLMIGYAAYNLRPVEWAYAGIVLVIIAGLMDVYGRHNGPQTRNQAR